MWAGRNFQMTKRLSFIHWLKVNCCSLLLMQITHDDEIIKFENVAQPSVLTSAIRNHQKRLSL